MALSTLITCGNAFEALLIKGHLDSEGIPCIIQGGNSSFIQAGMGFRPGFEVNVLVRDEDLEQAKKIIDRE